MTCRDMCIEEESKIKVDEGLSDKFNKMCLEKEKQVKNEEINGCGEEKKTEDFLDHKEISLVWKNSSNSAGPQKIYIGSERFARYRKGIDKFNIRTIVNCTIGVENKFEEDSSFKYHKVVLSDDTSQTILQKLPSATDFIQKSCGNVLIHCSKGVSRSCSVFLSWLIEFTKTSLRDGLFQLKSRRSLADPNLGFIKQLIKYERMFFATPSITIEDLLPCPVCLIVRYESSKFDCGHRCCTVCIEKIGQNALCAHCKFAEEETTNPKIGLNLN